MKAALLSALCLALPVLAAHPDAGVASAAKSGKLTPDAIKDVVDAHRSEVRACYGPAAKKKKDLAGKVVVRFVIGLDGKIASSSIGSTTLNEAQVEACLTQTVQKWVFPKPKHGTVEVNFPFQFGPPKKPASDQPPDEIEPDVLR